MATVTEGHPYVLIIAQLVNRPLNGIVINLTDENGEDCHARIDDSNTAPLTREQADQIAQRWSIGLP